MIDWINIVLFVYQLFTQSETTCKMHWLFTKVQVKVKIKPYIWFLSDTSACKASSESETVLSTMEQRSR